MKTLITGASGYVGARIYFDLKDKYSVVGAYFNNPLAKAFVKLDLTDETKVEKVVKEIAPEIIIHVANYPSPRSAVNNEDKFVALNDKATNCVIKAANNHGAKIVFISSQAANNPDNIYGKLKVKSEEMVKNTKNGFIILRPSIMYGYSPNITNPRPFNRVLECLNNKSKVCEFDMSWKLQPTYVGHLAQTIEKLIEINLWNKTIPILINDVTTQYEIARDILAPFGVEVKPIDQGINIRLSPEDLTEMNSLDLKPNSYKGMIAVIVDEIKNKDKFKLD